MKIHLVTVLALFAFAQLSTAAPPLSSSPSSQSTISPRRCGSKGGKCTTQYCGQM
ncbi:hypothetical protein BGX29_011563, partial [Mortierella sp. GBA35]